MTGGTLPEELFDSDVVRVTGQDEAHALDVVQTHDGKNRAAITEHPISYGVEGILTVGTSPVEAKVGVARLSGRRTLSISPISAPVWYGFSPTVSTTTGRKLFVNQSLDIPLGDVPLYLVAASAGVSVQVWEAK